MLRHDPLEEIPAPEQARVTPPELARAVASIETRKEAEAHLQASTISIGEALQQLDLGVTPDELLAEIQTQRAAALAATHRKSKRLRWRPILAGVSAALCLATIIVLGFQVASLRHRLLVAPMDRFDPRSPSVLLSTVPDQMLVHCDTDTLRDLARGIPMSQVYVDARQDQSQIPSTEWTLFKRNGAVYVSGWVSLNDSIDLLNRQGIWLYSSPQNPHIQNVRVTVSPSDLKGSVWTLTADKQDKSGVISAIRIPHSEPKAADNSGNLKLYDLDDLHFRTLQYDRDDPLYKHTRISWNDPVYISSTSPGLTIELHGNQLVVSRPIHISDHGVDVNGVILSEGPIDLSDEYSTQKPQSDNGPFVIEGGRGPVDLSDEYSTQ